MIWQDPSRFLSSAAEPCQITPFDPAVNPLSELTPLVFGPWIATFPDSVTVDEVFTIYIHCIHTDESYCPPSYLVQFYGPAAAAVPITWLEQISPRTVAGVMMLGEPGDYQVYAWPDDPRCGRWQQEDILVPVYKQAVQGSPHSMHASASVKERGGGRGGNSNGQIHKTKGLARVNPHRTCNSYEEILDGRWINYANVSSTLLSKYSYGQFHPPDDIIAEYGLSKELSSHARYVYSPYTCKIPHRTIVDVIDALPDLNHILFIGDSVARGFVCARVFKDLFGDDNMGVCEFHPESKVWEHGNKQATWIHPEDPKRSVDVTLAFTHGDFQDIVPFLETLNENPPEVVVFNMGYWIDKMDDTEFIGQYRRFFEHVDAHWAGAHVLVRSTTSVVQSVQCFEAGGHTRANSYRMRELALEAVSEWVERLKVPSNLDPFDSLDFEDEPKKTKVSFVDAYTITDSRPETTIDGYHWMYHAPELEKSWQKWNITIRPAAGEADDALLDWMWDEIVTGRCLD